MEREETADILTSWSAAPIDVHPSPWDHGAKKRKQEPGFNSVIRITEDEEDDEDEMNSEQMKDSEEPSNKRVKPVVKSNSLTGIITPVKTPALKRFGQSISRSISFRTEARPLPPAPLRSRQKASSFPRRRNSQCWSDTVESHDLTAKEIRRQEVIYELTQGERQLIDDLSLVKKVYYEPMLKLDIMTESELGQIFGTLDSLIPLHEGATILELIQSIVEDVNQKTGEAECQFYRRGLTYLEEGQRLPEIHLSRFLYCHGELKSSKGQRLHVFLFELVLVLTRPVEDRDGGQVFQIYRQPLPNNLLNLEEIPDGEPSGAGTFRGAFTGGNDKVRNCFRVSSRGRSKSQSHSLQASDSFDKQQWINSLRQAIVQSRDRMAQTSSQPKLAAHPDPALCHIADLSLSSDAEMTDHNSR
ncbi:rho guanine nucleotide exchange factor (GEF) 3, like [Lampris incognitus]|uniref:rho guanine nucleotide exchange factor (GEF) 3, like n=1 Tax=Lampris incognitus TaxID=2546036 RepID=UPI0024B62F5C|nr:rho guanine nucleotide exchange factor (GEF) 3, like [Lampris incognitus]